MDKTIPVVVGNKRNRSLLKLLTIQKAKAHDENNVAKKAISFTYHGNSLLSIQNVPSCRSCGHHLIDLKEKLKYEKLVLKSRQ